MQRCEITGVGIITGNKVSHSHRLTRRAWKPNLQVTTIMIDGTPLRVKVCSKTLKKLKGLNDVEVMKYLKSNEETLSPRIQKALNK